MIEKNRQESTFETATAQRPPTLEPIPKFPARIFGQQGNTKTTPSWNVNSYAVGTTGIALVLAEHNHVLFHNTGLNSLQISFDGSTWTDFLQNGIAYVLDSHTQTKQFWLRTTVATTTVYIQTW